MKKFIPLFEVCQALVAINGLTVESNNSEGVLLDGKDDFFTLLS